MKYHQIKYCTLLFLVLSLVRNSTAQEIYFSTDSIDKYVHQALEGWQLPGAAVCIVKDRKILLQKGYGASNWDYNSKVDEHTVFPISLKDKLYEQQITLADVLSHRSGWKTFQGDLLNTESMLAYTEMIQKFGQQNPRFVEPDGYEFKKAN